MQVQQIMTTTTASCRRPAHGRIAGRMQIAVARGLLGPFAFCTIGQARHCLGCWKAVYAAIRVGRRVVTSEGTTLATDSSGRWTVKESAAHPDQLAIGIDNETALIVRGGLAEVVGAGTVSMYDRSGRSAPRVVILQSGDRYDLSTRRKQ